MNSCVPKSACQYLFGQEADQIFTLAYLPRDVNKSAFVESCLEISLRVNIYLFTHQDGILLLDPRAYNKQCQLYAFRACQIHRTYHQKTDEEKEAQTEENRFLHLAFFLNYQFREKATYVRTVLSTLRSMNHDPFNEEFTLKKFKRFLKDEDRSREKASRTSFNHIFEMHTKEMLDQFREMHPLGQELCVLSRENLQIEGKSLGVNIEKLYTYPKLAGLAYLIDAAFLERIQFVLKVKVVNQHGCGGIVSHSSGQFGDKDPVIVFAGFATDGSCSVQEAMENAKQCPTYLYRNRHPKTTHPSHQHCFYCTPIKMDLEPYQKHLNRVMASAKSLLLGLGAEFMLQEQKPFIHYFQNRDKYPLLNEVFEGSLSNICRLDLEKNHRRSFAIYHTYTEIGKCASSDEFALDYSPEQFLCRKGIIHAKDSKLDAFCQEKLQDFCLNNHLSKLSRPQRKVVILKFEKTLLEQGFNINSRIKKEPRRIFKAARLLIEDQLHGEFL